MKAEKEDALKQLKAANRKNANVLQKLTEERKAREELEKHLEETKDTEKEDVAKKLEEEQKERKELEKKLEKQDIELKKLKEDPESKHEASKAPNAPGSPEACDDSSPVEQPFSGIQRMPELLESTMPGLGTRYPDPLNTVRRAPQTFEPPPPAYEMSHPNPHRSAHGLLPQLGMTMPRCYGMSYQPTQYPSMRHYVEERDVRTRYYSYGPGYPPGFPPGAYGMTPQPPYP